MHYRNVHNDVTYYVRMLRIQKVSVKSGLPWGVGAAGLPEVYRLCFSQAPLAYCYLARGRRRSQHFAAGSHDRPT